MAIAVEPLLRVRQLTKHFPIHGSDKVVQACSDVSLEVWPSETLGVVGESGSGKTTLGRCVLRLLEPTRGEIVFQGRDLLRLTRSQLRDARSDMQIVFQEPFDSFNPLSAIGKQIERPLRIHTKLTSRDRRARVRELLGLVGLPLSIADAMPRGVPPGALQRASIARALASDPRLIVLDEPTSALPPEAEADIIALLTDLQQRLQLAYIFISHDLDLVRRVSHRVAVMYLGQVVEIGSRDELFARPRHPYSRALLAAVLRPDPQQRKQRTERAERLEGEIPSPIDLPTGCYLASRCPHAMDRCFAESQDLGAFSPEHLVRCWRVVEGDLTFDSASLQGAARDG